MGFVEFSRWVIVAFSHRPRDVFFSSLAIIIGTSLYAYTVSVTNLRELILFLFGPLIISILGLLLRPCAPRPTTKLQDALIEYRARLEGRGYIPVSCEGGPGRAVAAGKILELLEAFGPLIGERRGMYYLCSNIIKPLTAKSRLSFAEFVGPSPVVWFVSHYWGHRCALTCAAIEKHSRGFGSAACWRDAAYWVCTLSNNQYQVSDELGYGVLENSSFFIALRSQTCKGTCMILDENTQPFSRSWCLFEYAQTLIRCQEDSAFHGLLLCMSDGVLNRGEGNLANYVKLLRRVTHLDLEQAFASKQEDKESIDAFVEAHMGGFEQLNRGLRDSIGTISREAKGRLDVEVSAVLDGSHPSGTPLRSAAIAILDGLLGQSPQPSLSLPGQPLPSPERIGAASMEGSSGMSRGDLGPLDIPGSRVGNLRTYNPRQEPLD